MSNVSRVSVLVDTLDIRHKGRQKLTPLEAQAALYSQSAKGNGPASDDLRALNAAIEERNFADAEAAVGRLQRDSGKLPLPYPAAPQANGIAITTH
jgi:hypothetical protein